MKTIDQDIKLGQVKQVYLLYGEERYLICQYRDKLVRALTQEGDTMNFTSFEGSSINPKEVIDLAETLPFFAERRVILIEKSGFFKHVDEDFADYFGQLPPTTYFIFVEEEIDKRNRLYKAVSKLGKAVEFGTQSDEVLMKWIGGRIRGEGKQITQGAYQLFISRTGTDMQNIEQELEKLICYTWERDVIREEDVAAITTEQINNQIFAMVDAIAEHQQKRALDLYYDLLALKEPPMRILFLIARQFQILLTVKTMSGQGFSGKDIASKAGCPEWAVRNKYAKQSRAFSVERIKQAIADSVAFEEAVKTGQMNDQISVEMLIVEYSGKE